MQAQESREIRGRAIAENFGQVIRIDETSYKVRSQSREVEYDVISTEKGWSCSCPDHVHREMKCKHIFAVEFSIKIRETVKESVVIAPVNAQACPSCQSVKVVKHGIRHNDYGDIQQFICKECRRTFVVNLGFERMHASPQAITSAMQLYFTGESLRNVQQFLRLQGVNVSHVCVYKWIGKYVRLMGEYLDQIQPKVGDKWRADEMYLKVKGNPKWLYAMIDDDTRYWIAMQVGDKKWHEDVRPMWREAREVAGKQPRVLITDGAANFRIANRKEYYSKFKARNTVHVNEIAFNGRPHNNKMERFNGELRDREKVMRSVKREDSAILAGMQIHHNFIRPHEGLDGQTPADRAGIKVEGDNKWLTIIQNASHVRPVNRENDVGLS
jgi:putative transposase